MLLVFIPSRYVPHYVKCCFFTSLNPPSPPSLISQIAFTSPVKLTASNILYPLDQMAPFFPLPFPPPSPLDASCISSYPSSCPQSLLFTNFLLLWTFIATCYISSSYVISLVVPVALFFPVHPLSSSRLSSNYLFSFTFLHLLLLNVYVYSAPILPPFFFFELSFSSVFLRLINGFHATFFFSLPFLSNPICVWQYIRLPAVSLLFFCDMHWSSLPPLPISTALYSPCFSLISLPFCPHPPSLPPYLIFLSLFLTFVSRREFLFSLVKQPAFFHSPFIFFILYTLSFILSFTRLVSSRIRIFHIHFIAQLTGQITHVIRSSRLPNFSLPASNALECPRF